MRFCKALLAVSLLLSVAACGHVHSAGIAFEPNPVPPPGYQAACSSLPLPFNAFITGCTSTSGEDIAVVRAKG